MENKTVRMEYEAYDNFFDGYADPFGASDYKEMTFTHVDEKTYRVSYADDIGGKFTADIVKKAWGVWNMGAMIYTDSTGTAHNMTSSATDYEFAFRATGKTPMSIRGGNHGNYPKDKNWVYYVDDSSYFNDRLLDITFYDGRSGERILLENIGDTVRLDGLRMVMHHNIYEMNYTEDNVLMCCERSYLYNGYDINMDARLVMAQSVSFGKSFTAMLPIYKTYGNCAMFYKADGSSVFMKTPLSNTVNDIVLGVDSTRMEVWGEPNPACHLFVTLHTPEDQFKSSSNDGKGYAGLREMLGGISNKLYCSAFSNPCVMNTGESLHFKTTWSFSYQPDFVSPDREPDFWVGVPKA